MTRSSTSKVPVDQGRLTSKNNLSNASSTRCAITQAFDAAYADELSEQGRQRDIPDAPQHGMEVAHIVSFSLNYFSGATVNSAEIRDAAGTWDMLRSWTQLEFEKLAGSRFNSPSNAIYMTMTEHREFGRFKFYFNKEEYPDVPHKYKAQRVRDGHRFSDGNTSTDVQFPPLVQSGIEPPNPEFLRIHAAFAKVLHFCGAAEYVESIERDTERDTALSVHDEFAFASLLSARLTILAR